MTSAWTLNLRPLLQPGDGRLHSVEWLTRSHDQPAEFFAELQALYEQTSTAPLKSKQQAGIDLYHDLVLRHLPRGGQLPALVYRSLSAERPAQTHQRRERVSLSRHYQSLTYETLHQACSDRCLRWKALGLAEGDALCIVSSVESELLIALLSGLRMGLCMTVLPPRGADFVARRMASIPNAKISAAARYATLLAPFRKQCLFVEELPVPPSSIEAETGSHSYAPEQSALALYTPFVACNDNTQPTPRSAASVFANALRDGMVPLGLFPSAVLAAPDADLLRYAPTLLLCALFHGATYLHVNASDLVPASEEERIPIPIDVLVVSRPLRDALVDRRTRSVPMVPQVVRRVIADALSPQSSRWDDLIQAAGFQQVPCAAWLFDAAAGGCLLFSGTRTGAFARHLQVAPGQPASLSQPGSPETTTARSPVGVFSPHPNGCGILLSPQDGGMFYCGTYHPSREGHPYPKDEVRAVVARLPFVRDCVILCEPGDRGHVSLLLFTGPEPLPLARAYASLREAQVREEIRLRLDGSALPDAVELFAMHPRKRNGKVDEEFYVREHGQGTLRRRESEPILRLLDALRTGLLPNTERVQSQAHTKENKS